MDGSTVVIQFDGGSHALEFGHVHEALGKNGFGHHAGSLHGGKHGTELGLHVGGETGVGEGLQMKGAASTVR